MRRRADWEVSTDEFTGFHTGLPMVAVGEGVYGEEGVLLDKRDKSIAYGTERPKAKTAPTHGRTVRICDQSLLLAKNRTSEPKLSLPQVVTTHQLTLNAIRTVLS